MLEFVVLSNFGVQRNLDSLELGADQGDFVLVLLDPQSVLTLVGVALLPAQHLPAQSSHLGLQLSDFPDFTLEYAVQSLDFAGQFLNNALVLASLPPQLSDPFLVVAFADVFLHHDALDITQLLR